MPALALAVLTLGKPSSVAMTFVLAVVLGAAVMAPVRHAEVPLVIFTTWLFTTLVP